MWKIFLLVVFYVDYVRSYGFPNMSDFTVFNHGTTNYSLYDFIWFQPGSTIGEYLSQGDYLISPKQDYALVLSSDGYLTLYRMQDGAVLWQVGQDLPKYAYPGPHMIGPHYVSGIMYGELQVLDYLNWNVTYASKVYNNVYNNEYCKLILDPDYLTRLGRNNILCVVCGCDRPNGCDAVIWCA